jgi:hypothetical protein
MEKKVISWVLIVTAILFVALDIRRALFGVTQFLLPVALLALGLELLGEQRLRKLTFVLAVVTAVLAGLAVFRRLM